MTPRGALAPAAAMAGFMAHLRARRFAVGAADAALALAALRAARAATAAEARRALSIALAADRDERARFSAAFDSYWLGRSDERERKNSTFDLSSAARRIWREDSPSRGGAAGAPIAGGEATAAAATEADDCVAPIPARAARAGALRRADFLSLAPADARLAARAARALARAMRLRALRRSAPSRRGTRLHFPRTMRANLSRGGELLTLLRRRRPRRPPRLVALVDVSGSMREYCDLYLAFLQGLVGADLRVEAFVFRDRLWRVTDSLVGGDAERALFRATRMIGGLGGGTRIARAIETLNTRYPSVCSRARGAVLIVSDGCDSDPPAELEKQMRVLRRKARRIVWLNPFLPRAGAGVGAPRGLAAAAAHVDLLARAAAPADLAALESEIARWRDF